MKPDEPSVIKLADYRPSPFLIDTVDLAITLDPARTYVVAKLAVRRNPKSTDDNSALVLDGELLELESVVIDGRRLRPTDYRIAETHLTIDHVPPGAFELVIVTVVNPQSNTALQGIYLSRGMYCSQCEAQGFRRITYFLDRPDVLAIYTVRIEAELAAAPVLFSNGNPTESGTLAGGLRHFAVWHDPFPKPCYLFAIVGGDLASIASTFKTASGRDVDLRIYVEHGKEDRAHWAMDALKRSFAWDEFRFGREYDLDVFNIVAVSDFNMGAMENKGLNIFNDRLVLASAETATDANYEAIESVVAHEYFHNWTGNRITCRDWFQLCLKEGLTVYRDQEFTADERSRTVQRIADVRQLKSLQFPEDQGPLAHPVRPESYIEINNFYTPTVYEKGAELVRMIETIVGAERFRAGMDLYFNRHDGDAATIEDFIRCFEEASGRDLAHFSLWYAQAGTPELVCDFHYDRVSKSAELTVHQSLRATPGQPHKKPLFIPLAIALLGANGDEIPLIVDGERLIRPGVLAVTKAKETFTFRDVPTRPVPSLLRGFSAPVNITIDLADDELAFLMAHDSDLFNRWQAANRFASRAILRALDGSSVDSVEQYAAAISQAVSNAALDDAYKAELLKLPTQSDIARDKANDVDPAAIDRVYRNFASKLSGIMRPLLLDTYRSTSTSDAFSPDAASAGRRALRNAALTMLSHSRSADDVARIQQHYTTASNMTDAAHAMALVASHDDPARQHVFDDFYERWQHDHLVIDMWFAAQAQSALPDTIERLKALTTHPLFKITMPNKVRALVGTFGMSNPVQFNRIDGAGYDFVATMVRQVDQINPQVAARILGAFRSYRALEPVRRGKASQALSEVASAPHISRDVGEIVSRMLEP